MSWTAIPIRLAWVLGLVPLLVPPARGEEPPPRPNILWILAEDMGPELGIRVRRGPDTAPVIHDRPVVIRRFTSAPHVDRPEMFPADDLTCYPATSRTTRRFWARPWGSCRACWAWPSREGRWFRWSWAR